MKHVGLVVPETPKKAKPTEEKKTETKPSNKKDQ